MHQQPRVQCVGVVWSGRGLRQRAAAQGVLAEAKLSQEHHRRGGPRARRCVPQPGRVPYCILCDVPRPGGRLPAVFPAHGFQRTRGRQKKTHWNTWLQQQPPSPHTQKKPSSSSACPALPGIPWTSGSIYRDAEREQVQQAEKDRLKKLLDDLTLPLVYFDVAIKGEKIGRIKMVLFKNESPRAVENFRALCTGGVRGPVPGARGVGSTTRGSAGPWPSMGVARSKEQQPSEHSAAPLVVQLLHGPPSSCHACSGCIMPLLSWTRPRPVFHLQPRPAGEKGIVPPGHEGAGKPYHFKVCALHCMRRTHAAPVLGTRTQREGRCSGVACCSAIHSIRLDTGSGVLCAAVSGLSRLGSAVRLAACCPASSASPPRPIPCPLPTWVRTRRAPTSTASLTDSLTRRAPTPSPFTVARSRTTRAAWRSSTTARRAPRAGGGAACRQCSCPGVVVVVVGGRGWREAGWGRGEGGGRCGTPSLGSGVPCARVFPLMCTSPMHTHNQCAHTHNHKRPCVHARAVPAGAAVHGQCRARHQHQPFLHPDGARGAPRRPLHGLRGGGGRL